MKKIFIIVVGIILSIVFQENIGFATANASVDNNKTNEMQDTKVNLYPFEQKGEWGYMDEIGNVKIEPKYDIAYYFSDGLALVGMIHRKSENGDWNYYKYGYIDIDGNIAIPIIYDNATPFRNGNAVIERHNYPVKYEKDEDDAYKDWLIKGTRYWIKPNGKFF